MRLCFFLLTLQTCWKEILLSKIGERVKFWRFTLLLICSMLDKRAEKKFYFPRLGKGSNFGDSLYYCSAQCSTNVLKRNFAFQDWGKGHNLEIHFTIDLFNALQTCWKEILLSKIGERVRFWRFSLLLICSMVILKFEYVDSFSRQCCQPYQQSKRNQCCLVICAPRNASLKLAPNMKFFLPQLLWLSLRGPIKILPCLGFLSICGYTFILASFFFCSKANLI